MTLEAILQKQHKYTQNTNEQTFNIFSMFLPGNEGISKIQVPGQ